MKRIVSKFSLVSISILALALAGPAAAQATRTWVSGVGDDANPCSRTAPCKTFAGAISKTAAKGEISVLDPGGFGGVTITKSISLNNVYSGEGGITSSGTTSIIINAAATDTVNISGLYLEGLGTGLNGINILSAQSVNIQDTYIKDFASASGAGINVQPSVNDVKVSVSNSYIMHNGSVSGGGGIVVKPTGSGKATLAVDNTAFASNGVGILVDGSITSTQTRATIRRSSINNSLNQGISVIGKTAVATPTTSVIVDDTFSSTNNAAGIRVDGLAASATVSRSTFSNNNGPGLVIGNNAVINTYLDNHSIGNTSADSALTTIAPK
jgi:hypothetical protein